jgi:hypothetical protein
MSTYVPMLNFIIGFITGQASAGLFARTIGRTKYQVMVAFTVGGTLLGCKSHLAARSVPDTFPYLDNTGCPLSNSLLHIFFLMIP